jgi:hypothetical protein
VKTARAAAMPAIILWLKPMTKPSDSRRLRRSAADAGRLQGSDNKADERIRGEPRKADRSIGRDLDKVEQSSLDSFPASDLPGWIH